MNRRSEISIESIVIEIEFSVRYKKWEKNSSFRLHFDVRLESVTSQSIDIGNAVGQECFEIENAEYLIRCFHPSRSAMRIYALVEARKNACGFE